MTLSLAELRETYARASLDESTVDPDPIVQFAAWFAEALAAKLKEPNAMTLATASRDGRPSARVVLLKYASEKGFVFFTNYNSRKGRDLADNPYAALIFYWAELERQVRVEGTVSCVSRAESEQYFNSRPLGSRLGAIVSEQSAVIPSRTILEARLKALEARYASSGEEPPMPDNWGGYCVKPVAIEFWQGRPNRLHDRLLFHRARGEGAWQIDRLSP